MRQVGNEQSDGQEKDAPLAVGCVISEYHVGWKQILISKIYIKIFFYSLKLIEYSLFWLAKKIFFFSCTVYVYCLTDANRGVRGVSRDEIWSPRHISNKLVNKNAIHNTKWCNPPGPPPPPHATWDFAQEIWQTFELLPLGFQPCALCMIWLPTA